MGWTQKTDRLWVRSDGAQAVSPEAPPEFSDEAKYPNAGKGWHADSPTGDRIRMVCRTAQSAMKAADETWPEP